MNMQFRGIFAATAALAAIAISGGVANADILTFTAFAMPGQGFQEPEVPISTQGFSFTAAPGSGSRVLIWNMADPHNADPGGATLGNDSNGNQTIMTKVDGGLFSVQSIDIADLINQVFFPCCAVPPVFAVLDFVGTSADSTTVSATFTTDTLPGLETFNLPTDFTNLQSFAWAPRSVFGLGAYPFAQVDNIVVTAVPESASIALFISVLAGFIFFRRAQTEPERVDSRSLCAGPASIFIK